VRIGGVPAGRLCMGKQRGTSQVEGDDQGYAREADNEHDERAAPEPGIVKAPGEQYEGSDDRDCGEGQDHLDIAEDEPGQVDLDISVRGRLCRALHENNIGRSCGPLYVSGRAFQLFLRCTGYLRHFRSPCD
jgi:hypothetical protein